MSERADRPVLDELYALSEVAGLINDTWDLGEYEEVAHRTPYQWWRRSLENNGIELPMPEPVAYVGQREKYASTPLWRGWELVEWYGAWKKVKSPRWVARARKERGK